MLQNNQSLRWLERISYRFPSTGGLIDRNELTSIIYSEKEFVIASGYGLDDPISIPGNARLSTASRPIWYGPSLL
jgi:hypothetical protein